MPNLVLKESLINVPFYYNIEFHNKTFKDFK